MSQLDYDRHLAPQDVARNFMRQIRRAALAGLPGCVLLALGIYSLAHADAPLHPVLGDRNVAVSLTVAGAMTIAWAFFRTAMAGRALLNKARALQQRADSRAREE